MYIDEINPKYFDLDENFDKKRQQSNIIRKIIPIFVILRYLGITENWSKTTVRVINREKLNEIGINRFLKYKVNDFYKND